MATDKTVTPAPSTPENLIMVDANTLAAAVATAVAQALAAQQGNQGELGKTIGDAVASGIAQTTRRKVTNGEYEARAGRNAYHPRSKAETPTLKRQAFQNDTLLQESTLFDREVELFNRLTHSGRYMDRLVEVIFSEDAVMLRYNNKGDHKFELKNHFRNLVELLEKLVTAQEKEDKDAREMAEFQMAERQKREAAKERHFGNSKNTQEARERAATGVMSDQRSGEHA